MKDEGEVKNSTACLNSNVSFISIIGDQTSNSLGTGLGKRVKMGYPNRV
jgi:hypothetical protein